MTGLGRNTFSLFAAALAALLVACTGTVDWGGTGGNLWGDPGDAPTDDPGDTTGFNGSGDNPVIPGGEDHPTGMPSCFDAEPAAGGTDGPGDVSGDCEVTEDCREPLICVEGECVAPNANGDWCDGIDIMCPYGDGSTCVGGFCVMLDGGCTQNADCPAGYVCEDGECVPEDGECIVDEDCPGEAICDFGICEDVDDCAINFDLRGEWTATSVLRLGEAAGGFLEAMQWIRDLMRGEGRIPGTESIFDGIVLSVLNTYLVPWEREVIIALGDINDLLDDTRVAHTITLDAECREVYRGTITFDHIELEFRGQTWSETPENIPYVGPIPPAEFGANLRCQSIAIDQFQVSHVMDGLLRWLADGIVQSATRGDSMSLSDLVRNVIDCSRISSSVLASYPLIGIGFEIACEVAVDAAAQAIDDALNSPMELTLMRLSGEATVADENRLLDGNWSGSFGIGDFTGDFTAARAR